jgi:hypothetical protein
MPIHASNKIPEPFFSHATATQSQQIKIIQLLPIPKYIPLDLTPIHPRNKIFHPAGNKERRIRNRLRPHPNMTLLNHLRSSLHGFRHSQPRHYNW